MIIDGRAIADDIYSALEKRSAEIGRTLTLGIVVAGHDPVIESFVRIKARAAERLGVRIDRADIAEHASTEEAIRAVRDIASRTDAIIVQLPLPGGIDVNAVLSEIPHDKDVDAINPRHSSERSPVEAPVALAVIEILRRGDISIEGKQAVVLGAGRLVGVPAAALLKQLGAQVSLVTLEQGSIADLKSADIIICGVGNPGFVKPEHVKVGVALIDAGTSEQGGAIVGDADPTCGQKAALFTPVPGGVGPVAVAMIFKNLFDLAQRP